ncbi:MAG: DUF1295 domain-containing protein [Alteromonadaceae bacterium]|nr:DUF1295 domain-containing protein [Alteromonadaceae bacterium]
MKALELKIPPVLLMLLAGAVMHIVTLFAKVEYAAETTSNIISIVLAVVAMLPVFFALLAFRKAETTVDPTHPEAASKLVTSGVFSYSRNPMYLSFTLALLAYSVLLNNLLGLFVIVFFVVYMNRFQILPEERFLTEKFGKQYTDYLLKVRRWL